MNRKTLTLVVAAILILGAAAAYLVARDNHGGSSPGSPAGPPPPAAVAGERAPPPVDQAQLDRLAQSGAARDQVLALRTAFEGGRPDARATERLAAAVRQVWPGTTPRWTAPCRNRVCRLTVEQPPPDWAGVLQRAPPVAAIADRFAVDPDGPAAVAYLLLAAENAPSGAPTLELVERSLASSPRVAECLRSATQAGTVEYELFIDTTGITYVRSGTADVETQSCVEAQLADIVTSTATPPKVKSESRRISLRTR